MNNRIKKKCATGIIADKRGSTATLFAVTLPLFVLSLGLSVETGYWMSEKSEYQDLADMAALAGGYEFLATSQDSQAKIAAKLHAIDSGFESRLGSIAVNYPPSSGSYAGQQAIEVIIHQQGERFFSSLLTKAKVDYTARSVVLLSGAVDPACIIGLSETESHAVEVWGNATVEIDDCVVQSNSNHAESLAVGGSGQLITDCATTAGGVVGENRMNLDCAAPLTNQSRLSDPYDHLQAPTRADEPCKPSYAAKPSSTSTPMQNNGKGKGGGGTTTSSITPGRFCSGDITINGPMVLDGAGTYIFDGVNLDFKGHGSLIGDEVTIILMNGAEIKGLNGNNAVNLSAPTDGDWKGVLIYSDRDTQPDGRKTKINGNSSSSFDGLVYLPNENLDFRGNSSVGSEGCLQIAANTVTFSGNNSIVGSGCTEHYGLEATFGASGLKLVE